MVSGVWAAPTPPNAHGLVLLFQLCIAKYNSGPPSDSVLFQDLIIGEGQGVEVGDSLEVAFTGWLFQNCGLGQVKLERELTAMHFQSVSLCIKEAITFPKFSVSMKCLHFRLQICL